MTIEELDGRIRIYNRAHPDNPASLDVIGCGVWKLRKAGKEDIYISESPQGECRVCVMTPYGLNYEGQGTNFISHTATGQQGTSERAERRKKAPA